MTVAQASVPAKGSLSEHEVSDRMLTTVLVTGASGYIASWISLYLLEQGFAVRGTTRNAAKGEWMKRMYQARGLEQFDYVVVSDLLNVRGPDGAGADARTMRLTTPCGV